VPLPDRSRAATLSNVQHPFGALRTRAPQLRARTVNLHTRTLAFSFAGAARAALAWIAIDAPPPVARVPAAPTETVLSSVAPAWSGGAALAAPGVLHAQRADSARIERLLEPLARADHEANVALIREHGSGCTE